ncbi:uncharacterized protein [Antedon mediterranea]|uniref:uncharacterized protein n=1 Tax=Antedon mediterranea TaxID=105859 RepID=UPI003AF66B0C
MAEQEEMTSSLELENTKATEEHEKQRRKIFHRDEVQTLIRIWGLDEFQEKFESTFCHHSIWEGIAEKMKALGYKNRTGADYKSKMANVKTAYFKHKKALKSDDAPMTDRNARDYFPEVEAVLESHPSTRNANVLDSMSSFCSHQDLEDESLLDAAEIIFKSGLENGSPTNNQLSPTPEDTCNSNGVETNIDDVTTNEYLPAAEVQQQKPLPDVQEVNKRKSCNPRKRKLAESNEANKQKEKLTDLFETMVDLERQSVALEKQRIDSERQFFHGMLTMMSQIIGHMTQQNSVGLL